MARGRRREWSHWDLWFALLCVPDHGGDWDGLDAEIGRSDGEIRALAKGAA